MNNIEKRKILCSVTFHLIALTCVVWSLYVLIDKTAEEFKNNNLDWAFWTKLVVVAIGFTGGLVFMYIQCKMYFQLCNRWRQYNRVILIQPITEEILRNSKKIHAADTKTTTNNLVITNNELNKAKINEESTMLLVNNSNNITSNLNQISQFNSIANNNTTTNETIELIIPDIIK